MHSLCADRSICNEEESYHVQVRPFARHSYEPKVVLCIYTNILQNNNNKKIKIINEENAKQCNFHKLEERLNCFAKFS